MSGRNKGRGGGGGGGKNGGRGGGGAGASNRQVAAAAKAAIKSTTSGTKLSDRYPQSMLYPSLGMPWYPCALWFLAISSYASACEELIGTVAYRAGAVVRRRAWRSRLTPFPSLPRFSNMGKKKQQNQRVKQQQSKPKARAQPQVCPPPAPNGALLPPTSSIRPVAMRLCPQRNRPAF